MIDGLVEMYPHIPVCMHQDHGNGPGDLRHRHPVRLHLGDDGRLAEGRRQDPGRLRLQRRRHPQVADMAHLRRLGRGRARRARLARNRHGREAEDGHGFEGKLRHDQLLTDPDEAVKFVKETQVDALAIAMGTSHGAYKFTRKPTATVLAMNVIEEIHRRLPNTHLVMHGSSSVPQDLQDIINEFGGEMKQTWGVPVEEIQRGIKHGVRKINIDTEYHRHERDKSQDRAQGQGTLQGRRAEIRPDGLLGFGDYEPKDTGPHRPVPHHAAGRRGSDRGGRRRGGRKLHRDVDRRVDRSSDGGGSVSRQGLSRRSGARNGPANISATSPTISSCSSPARSQTSRPRSSATSSPSSRSRPRASRTCASPSPM
jgi:hypothetical protein